MLYDGTVQRFSFETKRSIKRMGILHSYKKTPLIKNFLKHNTSHYIKSIRYFNHIH